MQNDYQTLYLVDIANLDKMEAKLRYQWDRLTHEDIAQNRHFDLMVGKLQFRYGYTKRQAEKALYNFLKYPRYNIHAE